jgi:hypothetical protein
LDSGFIGKDNNMAGQASRVKVLRVSRNGAPSCRILLFTFLCLSCAGSWLSECQAAEDVTSQRLVTIYAARGADFNLFEIFPNMIRGESVMEDTHFFALGYFHPLITPEGMQRTFDFLRIPNTRTGIEMVVGKHSGLQHNWEVGATWQLRFAPLRLPLIQIRPSVGIGPSYALGNPTFEDGPKGDPEKRYRFLNYNIYELQWSLEQMPNLSLVTRIHHRSGIWGIIAPPRVGSNFLAIGLRYGF